MNINKTVREGTKNMFHVCFHSVELLLICPLRERPIYAVEMYVIKLCQFFHFWLAYFSWRIPRTIVFGCLWKLILTWTDLRHFQLLTDLQGNVSLNNLCVESHVQNKIYNLMSSSKVKLTVITNVVSGNSLPPPFVCFPPPWKVETSTFFRVFGWAGSSQYTGNELFTSSDITDSPDDWDIRVPPRSFLTSISDVHFPLAVSPTAIGAGHEPMMNK